MYYTARRFFIAYANASNTSNNQITFKAVGLGTAKITVKTNDGSNLSDTCKVIVEAIDNVPDNGNNGNIPAPVNPDNGEATVSSYTLVITGVTGTVQKVQVNPDITLGKLATALKYTNIAKWTVKQANISEYEISASTTMQELASLLKNGDLLIIAYDSNGKAIGSAKVVKVTDSEMNVTLSKDTNVALRSAEEIAEGIVTTSVTVFDSLSVADFRPFYAVF